MRLKKDKERLKKVNKVPRSKIKTMINVNLLNGGALWILNLSHGMTIQVQKSTYISNRKSETSLIIFDVARIFWKKNVRKLFERKVFSINSVCLMYKDAPLE